jgi:hypothetical protein
MESDGRLIAIRLEVDRALGRISRAGHAFRLRADDAANPAS